MSDELWVAVPLVLGWTCVIVSHLRGKTLKPMVSSGGILLLASEAVAPDIPTSFIFDVDHQATGIPEHTATDGHISSQHKYWKRNHNDREVRKKHRVRSFEKFCRGGPDGAPPAPKGSFQTSYRTKFRLAIYKKLAQSALRNCSTFVFACGLLGVTCTWWLRTADPLAKALSLEFVFNYEAVKMNMKAAYEVHRVLLPLASFILAMYINQKLGWFFGIISLSWTVQGKLEDIAMFAGSVLLPRDDPVVLKARWTLYRYLNLVHFFLYESCGSRYKSVLVKDLLRVGLVTKEESLLLENSLSKRVLVISWIGTLMSQLNKNGLMQEVVVQEALVSVKDMRAATATVIKELTKNPPMSFAQLMQLMIDMLLLLTAPSMAYIFDTTRDSYSVYLWPAFASIVIALFYQGGMRIITAMEYPFGNGIDHLDPDWLLMVTDRSMYEYLTCSAPPSILCKDLKGCAAYEKPEVDVDDVKPPSPDSKETAEDTHRIVVEAVDEPGGVVARPMSTVLPGSVPD